VTHPSKNIFKALLLVGLVVLAVGTGPAAAKSKPPCWKTLINDWYDGRIDGTYPIHCYRDALKHLPTDVETYSSARDDIKQALQQRITQGRTAKSKGSGPSSPGPSGPSGPNSSGPNSENPTGPNKSTSKNSPIGDVFNRTKPKNADSVPIPLIVLGAVALLLMAAGGAGFLARRMRTRRLQLATAATIPQRPSEPPRPSG
jgi:hypothetical protein